MQRISSGVLNCSQMMMMLMLVFFVVGGSYAWSSSSQQVPVDDAELMKRMYSSYVSQLKRPYNFGLGKRSLEEAGGGASYEDFSSAPDSYNFPDKKAAPAGSMYSFGLGKKNRAYGFGLGKRLEGLWKFPSAIQSNRQERRSKIYSFGLGKRGSQQILDDYEENAADKRAAGRQFSFGLGKRDVSDQVSHAVSTTTS